MSDLDLQRREMPEKTFTRPPLGLPPGILGLLAIGLLLGLVLILMMASADEEQGSSISVTDTPQACTVTANADVNVRAGPDIAYERLWIWDAGSRASVLERANTTWYRIDGGWVSRDDVTLEPRTDCEQLPSALNPQIVVETITLPDVVDELGWFDILDDSFSTNANGWLRPDETPATVELGQLHLQPEWVIPSDAPSFTALEDAYYGLLAEWGGNAGTLTLRVRYTDDETGYQIGWAQNGLIWLDRLMGETTERLAVADAVFPLDFQVGALLQGNTITVFVQGEPVLTHELEATSSGTFALRSSESPVRVLRFTIRVPDRDVVNPQ